MLAGLVMSCGGEGPTPPPTVSRIVLGVGTLAVHVGQSRVVTATASHARGGPIPSAPLQWVIADPTIATVTPAGVVSGVAIGQTTLRVSSGRASATLPVEVSLVPVARIIFSVAAADMLVGTTATFRITALDSSGGEAAGWVPAWSVADTTIARVDARGVVTAVGNGTTRLRVRVDTVAVEMPLHVRAALDLAVTGLSFAQVVQNDSGTVPMIRGGLPVVVNAYVTADAAIAPRAWVRVRCLEGATVRWEDSLRVDVPLASVSSAEAPAAQFIMPNNRLSGALRCVGEADPAATVPDTTRANNRFPRTGEWLVTALEVPSLELTFVPIVLAADGGVIGNVNAGNLDQYLVTARQLLPLARVNPRVGQPFTTNTQFGGGTDAAWRAILREVEGKRVVDGYRGHYLGVIRPGAGITSVQFGGFGFISGWTALSVQVGWFNREASTRETVAHELGHNFGRPHAPCGNPAGPDPEYPYGDAAIGATGWDVYSSQSVPSTLPRAVGSDVRDLMSYCKPIWISDYSYQRMISGRQALATAAGLTGGSGLLVRGEVGTDGVNLDPLFAVDVGATMQAMEGVDLAVVDDAGAVLTRHRAPVLWPDHGGPGAFVAVIRVPAGASVRGVRAVVRGGRVRERTLDGSPRAVTVDVVRGADATRVRWDARQAANVLVRDDATGELLAFGKGGLLDLPRGTPRVRLAFSNGWRDRVPR